MIQFREKLFNKASNILKKGSGAVGVAGLGLSGYNLHVNQTRAKKEKEFYNSQEKATKELTKAINNISNNSEVTEAAENYHKSKKKPYKEVIVSEVIAKKKPVTKFKRKDKSYD